MPEWQEHFPAMYRTYGMPDATARLLQAFGRFR